VAVADITAAILAGGEGTRVGRRDKGLLPVRGRPLVAWVRDALADQVRRIVICANRNEAGYAAFGTVVADAAPAFHGPLGGIAAALGASESPWLLTVPVDSPQPPADLAERLLAHLGSAPAAVATATRREPLFALYRNGLAPSARDALEAGLGVWRWQDLIGAVEVDFSDCAAAFANLNTPEDFARWEANHHD
jgi:molybdenum cofactor guanylyltransferase